MPVYKIFASQDATIYSETPTANTGMDPVLELSKQASALFSNESTVARSLIKFSDDDLHFVSSSVVRSNQFKAFLRIFLADASDLPTEYTVIANPLYQSWDMGTGRYLNYPITIDGVSWTYRNANNSNAWMTGSFPANVVAISTTTNRGGGNWYSNYVATQSFGVYTEKDISLDVTSTILAMLSGSLTNNGFILRNSGSMEFDEDYAYKMAYFSRDTNTIYPPVLEFRWDDSAYNISTASGTSVTNQDIRVSISNNKEDFNDDEVYRFRLNVREQFPVRSFSTSSLYTVTKYLPSASYFSIQDAKNNLPVIDFDTVYTRISADSIGNYFDVYMNGLEPERYYKILIKTIISGSSMIFDDQYFFKVKQ